MFGVGASGKVRPTKVKDGNLASESWVGLHWDFTKMDMSTGHVPDISGHGNHGQCMCALAGKVGVDHEDCAVGQTYSGSPYGIHREAEFIVFHNGWGAFVEAAGKILDSQDKYVIWGATMRSEAANGGCDTDAGNAHAGTGGVHGASGVPQVDYTGYNIGNISSLIEIRLFSNTEATSMINGTFYADFQDGEVINIVGGYRPGAEVMGAYRCFKADGSIDTGEGSTTTGVYPSLIAQDGYVGYRAQDYMGENGVSCGVKNFFIYVFDDEPANMMELVRWLTHHPDKVPSRLIPDVYPATVAAPVLDSGWHDFVTSVSEAVASTVWVTAANALISDNTHATCSAVSAGTHDFLMLFNLTPDPVVPAGATITGVEVEFERTAGTADGVVDGGIHLIKGGVIQTGADDKSAPGEWPTTGDTYYSYGGASDTWGVALTDADVNSPSFGVALRVTTTASFKTAQVDHVRMKVYYQE